jgi:type II secretory pathway pseudopilin PulG
MNLMQSKVVPGKNKKYDGFLLAEMIVALTVTGMLLVGFALALHAFATFNRYQLVRQRCIAAAQAQLESIAVTGKQISTEDFERLWPKLDVSVKKSAGTGQWKDMKLVEVTTQGKSFRKEVKVQLSRYILTGSIKEDK